MPATKKALPERIIIPVSGAGALREQLGALVTGFPEARALAWRLFLRDTRAAYRQSLLGFAWLLLPPLATTAVWIYLNSQDIVSVDSGPVPYPLFVLFGTVLWAAFNGALTGTIGVVGEAGSMIAKLNFPHEALLLSAFLKNALNTAIQAAMLVVAFVGFGQPLGWGLAFLPLGLVALMLLGSAVGVVLVPLASLYHDVNRGAQLALRFGFFLTPVAYPIPDTAVGKLLGALNPVSPLLVTTRGLATGGETPLWTPFVLIIAGSALLLLVGVVVYKLAMPRLIERMSS